MPQCKRCGSYAICHNFHGRDGSDGDLCDVCYWRKRAEATQNLCQRCLPVCQGGEGCSAEMPAQHTSTEAHLQKSLNVALVRQAALKRMLENLLDATALHHKNIFDIDNRANYNAAKFAAIKALGRE